MPRLSRRGGDKESLSKKENGRLYGDGQCRGVRPRDTVDCPRKKTRILNGEEWWPNEAKLVDPTAVAPTTAIWKRYGTAAKIDEDFSS